MAEKVAIEFSIGDGPAIKSMGDLKRQLKEANFEALKMSEQFGAASQQAIDAAKKVGQLKDAIGDAKDLTDAFNPDAKFKALGGAIQGVTGGFAAAQGALALFGSESEDLQKTLVKVQGALALSQGLDSILAAKDAFKNLKAVAVDTFNSLKTAIGATGIGLLVVGVGLLIANFDKLKSLLGGVSEVQKQVNSSFEAYTKAAQDATQKTLEVKNAFDLAKKGVISKKEALDTYNNTLGDSLGKTNDINKAEEIFRQKADAYIKVQGLKAQANALMTKSAELYAQSFEAQAQLEIKTNALREKGYVNAAETLTSNFKKTQEENNKIADELQKKSGEIGQQAEELSKTAGVANEYQQKQNEEAAKAQEKAAEDRKKKRDEEAKKVLEANKKANEDIEKQKQDNYLKSIQDEDERKQEKLRIEYKNQKKLIEQSSASEKLKNEQIKLLTEQFFLDQNALTEEQNKNKNELIDKQIQDEIDRLDKFNEIDAEKIKKKNEEDLKAEEEKNKALEGLQQSYFDTASAGIGILKQFGDKNKAIQKAALIAENAITIAKIILDTQKANAAVTAKYALVPGGQIPAAAEILANKIKAGIGIATAIAATAKGLQGIGGGGGGSASGGGQSLGGGGAAGGQEAPVAPALSSTALNQQMINNLNSATNRAFVLESDISGNQERIQRLNRAARIS
jgi:hypothetical protein